ncbi:multivesicular body subunit 12A [Nothobranchius furzeri]|uniref:Multivesicular body subunit 12A n=1 Tax=Nothobranchius furzeri TaxID=105023 RepID=A0A1A8APF4_NOTFU|nr:multivesicular body subunit 12A [Nothobranchius furzeri]XP_054599569.1 multivesicular body subunit 12A [Nothobranchius furzeri]KAF7223756.1 multivesicular body subunit 12A [Nothobranchius furzeri]
MEHLTVRPVTGLAWTSNSGTCPKNFTLISFTEDGATANFVRGFAIKSGYYLCYSKDLTDGKVVSDIQIISEKDSIPQGYFAIAEYLEPKTSVSKKKRVCARYSPVSSVDTAVLDIKLTSKSKMMLQHYTYVGDVNGYVLWCRKGQFTNTFPQPKPRNVGLDMRKLSLDQPDTPPALPLRHSNPPPPATLPQRKLTQRRCSLHSKDNLDKSGDGSVSGVTALDGVPFSLHPDYDFQANGMSLQLNSQLNNIRIKSLADIENEYNYTFSVEESAAKRTRPSISAEAAPSAP